MNVQAGATAAHGTVSSPSRTRDGGSATGQPRETSSRTVSSQRERTPNAWCGAAVAQQASREDKQRVDALTRDVPVDQRLRQPFGDRRRPVEARQPHRQRQRNRPGGRNQHPRRQPADLVARALDQQATRSHRVQHQPPRARDFVLRVLPQDVERAHQHGPRPGQLEPAAPEVQERRRRRPAAQWRPARGRAPGPAPGRPAGPGAATAPARRSSPGKRRNRGRRPTARQPC